MENFTRQIKQFVAYRKVWWGLISFLLLIPLAGNAQLSGNYTIDPNGSGSSNYTSFAAAVSDLSSSGVSGPVTFTVSKDTFNEHVAIHYITGASATNTITFEGKSRTKSYIYYDTNSATVYLDSAQHIIFNNLTIEDDNNVGTSYQLVNNAHHNSVTNCNLYTNTTSSNTNVNVWIEDSDSSLFKGNLVKGGYYGFYTAGNGSGAMYLNNEVTNYYYYGMYMDSHTDQTIDGNYIHAPGYTYAYGIRNYYGDNSTITNNTIKENYYNIYVYYSDEVLIKNNSLTDAGYTAVNIYYSNDVWVDSNQINDIGGMGVYSYQSNNLDITYNRIQDVSDYGLYMYYNNNGGSDTTLIANNMIGGGITGYYGCFMGYCFNTHIIYNSFLIDASDYGFYQYGGSDDVFKNNSLYVRTAVSYGAYFGDYDAFNVFDYNNIYAPKASTFAYFDGTQNSLSDLKSAHSGYNKHDISEDPLYISNYDLHSRSALLNNAGDEVSYVKDDIDGETRPMAPDTLVDIGADEFYLSPYDMDVFSIENRTIYIGSNNMLKAVFANAGSKVIQGDTLNVSYSTDGGSTWTMDSIIFDSLSLGDTMHFTFSKPFAISSAGTYNICVRIDEQVPGDPDTDDKMCIDLCTGKKGNFTIDPSGNGDFKTFSQAVSALQCGVTGPVTIKVDSGTYNDQIYLDNIPGASSTNTVTFEGVDKKKVVLKSSGSNWAVITLDGMDYVTIKNMTIVNPTTGNGGGIFMTDQADHNTIENCIIDLSNTVNGSSACIMASGSAGDPYAYQNSANYTTIKENDISGGYYGLAIIGASSSIQSYGQTITDNNLSGQEYYSVTLYYQNGLVFDNNTVDHINSAYSYATRFYYCSNFEVTNNFVRGGYYGLYFYYANNYNYNSSFQSKVVNNISASTYQYGGGMYSYQSQNVPFYHNTFISTYATSGYGGAYFYYNSGVDVRNNIFLNYNGGGAVYEYGSSFDHLDYNLYYANGNAIVNYSGSTYNDLQSFQSGTGYEEHGYQDDPDFVKSPLYHLAVSARKYKGDNVGVMYDIDGDQRCIYSPTVGADEGNFVYPSPNAKFISPDSVFVNSPVLFQAVAAQGTQEGYHWYVNNSLVSTNDTFSYTFTKQGMDTVALKADNCGGSDSVSVVIKVKVPTAVPVIDFTADKYKVDQYDTVQFFDYSTNGPTSWTWQINPQYTSQGASNYTFVANSSVKNPKVVFLQPGKYEVCLQATNSVGSSKKVCKSNYIDVRKTLDMCVTSSTSSPSGTLYDDLGSFNSYSPNINCNFRIQPCGGEITLKLDKFDLEKNDFLRIYDGVNANGKPLWDVPNYGLDGITGNIKDPGFQRTFKAKSGVVYIEFESDATGQGNGWALSWTSKNGGNYSPPVASFEVPDTVCGGIRTWFNNTSKGSYNSYEWYLDNSLFPIKKEDYSAILDTGSHKIELKAVNCGGRDSVTKNIQVVDPTGNFTPGFMADNLNPEVGVDVVTFTDTTRGCVDQFKWEFFPHKASFVNGTNQYSKFPQVQFFSKGCFDVRLIVGSGKNADTLEKKCYIDAYGYCIPKVAILNPDVGINRVIFKSIDKSSLSGEQGYSDFTSSSSTNVEAGESYEIKIERNSNINPVNAKVWMDFNLDGDFNDSGEVVATSGTYNSATYTDTIHIPTSASIGNSRMRIGINYNKLGNDPCGPNRYGEFEDYSIIIGPDVTPPEISLIGNDTLNLEACMSISSLNIGATAMDNADGNITSQIKMDTSNVDPSTKGIYPVTYDVQDATGNHATTVTQYINVIADATDPVLTLNGSMNDTIAVYSSYKDPGYNASDNCSGINNVVVTSTLDTSNVGQYSITYTADDKAGNTTTMIRTINVIDTVAPTYTYQGPDTILVDVNQFYNLNVDLPSISASDNYNSNVTTTLSGTYYDDYGVTMIPTKLGVYDLTITFIDGSGNSTQKTLYINVVDRMAPVVTLVNPAKAVAQIERFDKFNMDNYLLNDNYYDSADITVSISGSYIDSYLVYSVEGLFYINYTATDPSGNSAVYQRWVNVVESTSGIEKNNVDQPQISLYPNPTSGQFLINVELPTSGKVEIDIVNELGKQVTEVANENIIKGQYNVNLAEMGAGIYFVRIRTQDQVTMKRIVLTK